MSYLATFVFYSAFKRSSSEKTYDSIKTTATVIVVGGAAVGAAMLGPEAAFSATAMLVRVLK